MSKTISADPLYRKLKKGILAGYLILAFMLLLSKIGVPLLTVFICAGLVVFIATLYGFLFLPSDAAGIKKQESDTSWSNGLTINESGLIVLVGVALTAISLSLWAYLLTRLIRYFYPQSHEIGEPSDQHIDKLNSSELFKDYDIEK